MSGVLKLKNIIKIITAALHKLKDLRVDSVTRKIKDLQYKIRHASVSVTG